MTFQTLPTYELRHIGPGDWYEILKNGKGHSLSTKANCLEWLEKWACGRFKETTL